MKIAGIFSLLLAASSFVIAKIPGDEFFRVETLAEGLEDAMEIAVAHDGRVFIAERKGRLKLFDPGTAALKIVADFDVAIADGDYARECGLLGITLDPKFRENGWLYLYWSHPEKSVHVLSRHTFHPSGHLRERKLLLEVPHDRSQGTCHEAGSLAFGPDGCLFLSTGDNTCPFHSDGSAPIDERRMREWGDAQRSASNTNDLRGKILRIKPTAEGSYTIPEGNLFPLGLDKTRPEIFVMGCRNPYRISVDQRTGFLYWGKIGPDGGVDSPRGPRGYDEINQARSAGNYGWPYFSADNKAYADFNFATKEVGEKFDPAAPRNDSPNNTGLLELPPAQPAFWHYPRASACAGPVFYADDHPKGAPGLPSAFDSSLIIYDWTSTKLQVIQLDDEGKMIGIAPWLDAFRFVHPNDMELGPEGEVYILEYGTKWYDGNDGKLKKVTYSEEALALKTQPKDPRLVGLPESHVGTKLITDHHCLACHQGQQMSIGPSFEMIAQDYLGDPLSTPVLAEKILVGGSGVWGTQPMPPHAHLNLEQTLQMSEAILATRPKKK